MKLHYNGIYVTNYALRFSCSLNKRMHKYQTVLRLEDPFPLILCVCFPNQSMYSVCFIFEVCSPTYGVCIISTSCKILSHVTEEQRFFQHFWERLQCTYSSPWWLIVLFPFADATHKIDTLNILSFFHSPHTQH